MDDAALYMARAAFWLAVLAASGVLPHAVPQDTARALRLMRVAAKHGLLEAHTALAYRHFTGNHVEQSCETAYQHLQVRRVPQCYTSQSSASARASYRYMWWIDVVR